MDKTNIIGTGYSLGGEHFAWSKVERISVVRIYEHNLQAVFFVHFQSGSVLEYSQKRFKLEWDYIETSAFFGTWKRKVKINNIQHYFDRGCDKLKEINKIRDDLSDTFSDYRVEYEVSNKKNKRTKEQKNKRTKGYK